MPYGTSRLPGVARYRPTSSFARLTSHTVALWRRSAGRTAARVEDVITTGGAVIAAARALRDLGATVTTVVCAIDGSSHGASGLASDRITVRSVLTKKLLDAVAATS